MLVWGLVDKHHSLTPTRVRPVARPGRALACFDMGVKRSLRFGGTEVPGTACPHVSPLQFSRCSRLVPPKRLAEAMREAEVS